MAEEFQESDIIFSDHHCYGGSTTGEEEDGYFDYPGMGVSSRNSNGSNTKSKKNKNKKKKKKKKNISSSLPVNIPNAIFHCPDADDFEEEYEDGEITPPHVIIGRRIAGNMAFSVCTGNGRTLKGRDLSQVRNTILRLTGFLET